MSNNHRHPYPVGRATPVGGATPVGQAAPAHPAGPDRPRFLPGARHDAPPAPADVCLLVSGRDLLLNPDRRFPRIADLPDGAVPVPLGTLDGIPVWAADVAPATPATGGDWLGWPAVAAELAEPLAALAGRALQVVTWRRSHRYCGACASELTDVPGEHARRCPDCGLYAPMQLSPAVLVAILRTGPDGGPDQLLLVRHSYGATGIWALVAGFVEAGETLEEAVHREVAEEVGLRVTEPVYFGSQPWALSGPGVILAGFTARCADPYAEPTIDNRELTDARWFDVDALPADLPQPYSISRWLIDHTRPD